jgi:hypothetical protein
MSTLGSTSPCTIVNVSTTPESHRDGGFARSTTKHDYIRARLSGPATTTVGSAQVQMHHSSHHGSSQGTVEHALLTSGVVVFLLVGAVELLNLLLTAIAHINAWVLTTNLPTLAGR